MTEWLGVQEDLGDGLRDTVIRKQEELARMAEVVEDDFLGPVGTDQSTSQAPTTSTSPSGPTKARIPEYRRAGTKINEPQGRAGEETEISLPAPWKLPYRRGNSGVERGEEGSSHSRATHETNRDGPKQDGGEIGKVRQARRSLTG